MTEPAINNATPMPAETREVGGYAPIDSIAVQDSRGPQSEETDRQQVPDREGNSEKGDSRGPSLLQHHERGDQQEHGHTGSLKAQQPD